MVAFLRVLSTVCFCLVHVSAFTDLSRRSYLNTSQSSTTLHVHVSPSSSHTRGSFILKPEVGTGEPHRFDPPSSDFASSQEGVRTTESAPGTLSKPAINTAHATPSPQLPTTTPSSPSPPDVSAGEGQSDVESRSSGFKSGQGAIITPAQPSRLGGTSRRYYNGTSPPTRTLTSSPSLITSFCSSRRPDEPYTVWIVLPNPTTITLVEGDDYPSTAFSSVPEFTPPVYCPEPSTGFLTKSEGPAASEKPSPLSSFTMQPPTFGTPFFGTGKIITTFITTSKNPVVLRTPSAPPIFPVPGVRTTSKKSVDPASVGPLPPSNVDVQSLESLPIQTGQPGANLLQATNVVIVGGAVFSAIGSSVVVFDRETITYGGTATLTTTFHNEIITIDTDISFDHTTLGGPGNSGMQLGIAGGVSVTEIGQTIGVIGSVSLTVGPGVSPTTVIVDEYTITANSDGLEIAGTIISYPFNVASRTIPADELTVQAAGSTFTLGSGGIPSSTTFTPYTRTSELVDVGSSDSLSTPSATETAAKTSKKSAATFSEPMSGLLGICLMICIGALG